MLFRRMMIPCTMLTRTQTEDGEGGANSVWKDGRRFSAAVVLDTSAAVRKGERDATANLYTVTTSKDDALRFHDVIRRGDTGETLRIISDAKSAPAVSTLDMAQVTAERWELT